MARPAQGPAAEERGARLANPTLRAWGGTPRRLRHALFVQARERAGEDASPAAAIIDGRGVRSAGKGARASIRRATTRARRPRARGAASSSTRRACCRAPPSVEAILADGACRGEATARAVAGTGRRRLEIVRRGDGAGLVPPPERRVVERTFAWLGRRRRLAEGFENLAVDALAFPCLGMIRLMPRRLARASARS